MRSGAAPASSRPGTKFSDFGKGPGNKDDYTVRVSNLPEEATDNDLMELFKPFGTVNRVFLAKDKNKQISRGFAFVTFMNKDDAQRAIWGVNDYGYNHLILKVEWAKYGICFFIFFKFQIFSFTFLTLLFYFIQFILSNFLSIQLYIII